MKRKFLSLLFVLCFGAIALTGCGSSDSDSSTASTEGGAESGGKLKVKIGTQEMPNDEGIAKALGYFEEEMGSDVDVEVIKFSSGKDVNTALASGSIDFGLEGSCPATIAISQDLGVEFIWIHEVLGSVESLVARKDTGIKDVKDLVGKSVAVPFASTAHFSLLKAMDNAGIKSTDLKLYDMEADKIYASWENKDIDAAYIWQPTLAELKDSVTVCTSEDMAKAGYMTSNCEVVRKEFASAHPEIVKAYVKALDKAARLFQDDQKKAVSVIAKALELSDEDALFQMTGSTWLNGSEELGESYLGTSEKKGAIVKNLMDTASFLKEQGSIPSVPDEKVFSEAVNPSYVESISK